MNFIVHLTKRFVTLVVPELNLSVTVGSIGNFIWKFKTIAYVHVHVPRQIPFEGIFPTSLLGVMSISFSFVKGFYAHLPRVLVCLFTLFIHVLSGPDICHSIQGEDSLRTFSCLFCKRGLGMSAPTKGPSRPPWVCFASIRETLESGGLDASVWRPLSDHNEFCVLRPLSQRES